MTRGLRWLGILLCVSCLCSCNIRLPVEAYRISPRPLHQTVANASTSNTATQPVWLVADEHHTGMVFSYPWLIDSGFKPPHGFPDCPYVTMSWGNIDAYSQHGVGGIGSWAEVLFTPTDSVLEIIPVTWKVQEVMPHQRIWTRRVPADCGPSVAHFLNQCIKSGPDGNPLVVRPSSWGRGVQVLGNHPYFIPRVCNVWSAQAIESMGGEINPWQAVTADGLIQQIEAPPNDFVMIWNGGRPQD